MRADYGEALTAAAGGIVTEEARAAFERALDDKANSQGPVLCGPCRRTGRRQAEGECDLPEAPRRWARDAPWLATCVSIWRSSEAPATAPAGEAAAIAALAPDAQQTAIRGMVDRLAERLAQNGDDAQGWLRLIRAYGVLHETDKARDALARARKAMTGDEAANHGLDALAQEFGLGS